VLQFFAFDVVGCGVRLTEDIIYCQLDRIVQTVDRNLAEGLDFPKVGILTAARRDSWARTRLHLIQGCSYFFCLRCFQQASLGTIELLIEQEKLCSGRSPVSSTNIELL
jgi:Choline/Carnitine o-acyltransferase